MVSATGNRSHQGNLSSHLMKLEEEGYVEIEKTFRGKIPLTLGGRTGGVSELPENDEWVVEIERRQTAPDGRGSKSIK